MKADILTQVVLPLSLFIIMFGMGLSLKKEDFLRVLKQPKSALVGISAQLFLLPLIGILIIAIFQLPGELAVGLLVLSLCPGGTTSNLFAFLARGDVALSITLTAIVSLITPFTIPIMTAFAMDYYLNESQSFSLPIVKTILQLLLITVVPVVIGMVVHYKASNFSRRAEKPVKIFSIIFLFIIILGIILKNRNEMLGFFVETGVATLALNLACLILGFYLARLFQLSREQSVTIGLEVGIQNGTTALLVTGTLLGNSLMTVPAVTYSLIMFLTGGLFAWWLKGKGTN